MPHLQLPPTTTLHSWARWPTLGVVLAALIALIGAATSVTSVGADGPIAGNAYSFAAQATSPVGPNPGPRLQPVGNGDTIASPVDATDDSDNRDGSWWWRVVFSAAVAAVVLISLIQRRGTPDPSRRTGSRDGTGRRGNDRNVLGH